jgi:carboxymethylenebutenolidase
VLLVVFLAGLVAVDALAGGGRVAALINTSIPGPEGRTVGAYVACPAGEGPFPAVIMLHEFWGLKAEIVEKAEALAAEGYVVVAPDLYRGQTTACAPARLFIWL